MTTREDAVYEEDAVHEEDGATEVTASGEPAPRPPWWRRLDTPVLGLAVATVGVLAAGTALGLSVRDHSTDERRRAEAVQVARQQVLNLTTLDHRRIDAQLDQLVADSTGEFRSDFRAMVETFAETVRTSKVDATGVVAEAGVVRLGESTARVVVASSSQVTNTEAKEPETRQYRMAVDLSWEGDRWLVSGMEFVP